jgi:hypothetical protein
MPAGSGSGPSAAMQGLGLRTQSVLFGHHPKAPVKLQDRLDQIAAQAQVGADSGFKWVL